MKSTTAIVFTILASALATPAWANWWPGDGNPHGRGDCNHRGGRQGSESSSVPEIDPGLAQSALTVLAGGVLMLKGQRRK